MAQTVADFYSDEIAQSENGTNGSDPLKPNEYYGRVRMARFSFTSSTDMDDGEDIFLCKLPKGARIIDGAFLCGGLGAGCQVDIGLAGADASGYIDYDNSVSDDVAKFLSNGDVAAAGKDSFAQTLALGYGYELTKDCYLTATVEAVDWDGSIAVAGHVLFVVD